MPFEVGCESVIEAGGCEPAALRSLERLQALVARMQTELSLHPVEQPQWHVFAGEGGVTGLVLLAESHIALHTFPEYGLATLNLYCCRPRARWPWEERLAEHLGATRVRVRELQRGWAP